MTDINKMISQTKSDIFILAEYLFQNNNEIDQYKLTELLSNHEIILFLL